MIPTQLLRRPVGMLLPVFLVNRPTARTFSKVNNSKLSAKQCQHYGIPKPVQNKLPTKLYFQPQSQFSNIPKPICAEPPAYKCSQPHRLSFAQTLVVGTGISLVISGYICGVIYVAIELSHLTETWGTVVPMGTIIFGTLLPFVFVCACSSDNEQ